MIDHLVQRVLVSFGKALVDVPRVIGVRPIDGGWSNSAKGVQAAVMSFDDVAELVVCEEKDIQIDSGVGLNPSFSRKLMVLW